MHRIAFVFDLDGTLADTEPIARDAWAHALALHGLTLDDGTVEAMFGLRMPESLEVIYARHMVPVPPSVLERQRDEVYATLMEARLRALPGTHEALQAVRSRGIPCALATSGRMSKTADKLRILGLGGYFDALVTGDDVANGKPAPDTFLLAAERLGVPPTRCWAVEDAPNGVEAALAAGMKVVIVPNEMTAGLTFPPVDLRVKDLFELARRVPEMVGERAPRSADSSDCAD